MAQEVFKAAGDPNVFPDQIAAGLKPWTPLKDYARTPWFGNDDGKLAVNVSVPEGNYDPVLGMSYVQIAREGLGYQKSQTGGGMIPKAGALDSTYHRYGALMSVPDKETSFFDGIDISLAGIASLAQGRQSGFSPARIEGTERSGGRCHRGIFGRPARENRTAIGRRVEGNGSPDPTGEGKPIV